MTATTEHATERPRTRFEPRRLYALLLDWLCVVAFVAMGKENHGVHRGIGWFFNVWWPLAVGIVVGGLVTRLYATDDRWPARLLATVAIAVLVGGPLRALTDRPVYSVFTAVAFGVLTLLTFAWRLLRVAYRQVRGTR